MGYSPLRRKNGAHWSAQIAATPASMAFRNPGESPPESDFGTSRGALCPFRRRASSNGGMKNRMPLSRNVKGLIEIVCRTTSWKNHAERTKGIRHFG